MKIERLIAIIVILLRKERVQAKELAETFAVSVRTIMRDIETLNMAGIPIVTYQGMNGGIGLVEGYRFDKTVLTDDEMATIITTLKGLDFPSPCNGGEILVEKLKNSLSAPRLEMLNSKLNQLIIDVSPWGRDGRLKDKAVTIREAIANCQVIEFFYLDSQGRKTLRKVEPCTLILKGQNWYLYGFCLLRQDFRLFKLLRIKEIKLLDEKFQVHDISLEDFPWEDKWLKGDKVVELELVFEKEVQSIVEEWFAEEGEVLESGQILIRTSLPENNWLYGFLLSFGKTVEVISPPRMRKIMAEMAAEIYGKYSKEHDRQLSYLPWYSKEKQRRLEND